MEIKILHNQQNQYGTLILASLPTAPFPDAKRALGHFYRDQFFPPETHYTDSTVAIFIPNYFKSGKTLDCIVHFHGWWNDVSKVLETYQLMEQLTESKKNAILIIPQGPKNVADSFGGKLEAMDGFKYFLQDVLKVLRQAKVCKKATFQTILLSGHSAAYRVVAHILLRGGMPIQEVWIFDGLYAQLEKFTYWLMTTTGRFINTYTYSGGTREATREFMKDMKAWEMPYWSGLETNLTSEDLCTHRILHIFSWLDHNEVIHVETAFLKYLKTSALKTVFQN